MIPATAALAETEAVVPLAKILKVGGNPKLRVIAVKDANQRFAKAQDSLSPGDKIVTESGQTALLGLPDGSEVSIAPSSSFQIEALLKGGPQRAECRLFYGMARVLVKADGANLHAAPEPADEIFILRTKSAMLGARAPAEFIVQNDPISEETQVHALSGGGARFAFNTLDLSGLRGALAVPAGFMSRLERGARDLPRPRRFEAGKFRRSLRARSSAFERQTRFFHPLREKREGPRFTRGGEAKAVAR